MVVLASKMSVRPNSNNARRQLVQAIGRFLLGAAVGLSLVPFAARAQDRFEIQVYDSQTAPPLGVGLEVHVNYDARGATETTEGGELPTHRVSHYTLEPHLGLADCCEVGGYFQTAFRPEGRFDYAGVKLRFKVRLPRRIANLIGFALNTEISAVPRSYEANRYGSELRPIADLRYGRLYASINPILSIDFAGSLAGRPQFQPATKISWDVLEGLGLGLEHYAGLGPIDGLLSPEQQSHFLFGAVDWTGSLFDFNLAAGRGFGQAEPWVAKVIFSIHWDRARDARSIQGHLGSQQAADPQALAARFENGR